MEEILITEGCLGGGANLDGGDLRRLRESWWQRRAWVVEGNLDGKGALERCRESSKGEV